MCRLTVVFLAFDLFFIIFCIGMAFVIFFALCCCIPLVAFAYAMTIRKGASEDDIDSLPKYRFRQANPMGIFDNDGMKVVGAMESGNSNSVNELSLHPEDSVSANSSSFFFLCSLVLIFNHIRFIWLLKFIASFCMEASFLLLIIFHSLSPFLFFQQGSLHLLHAIIIFEPICLASIQIYCDVCVDFNRIL